MVVCGVVGTSSGGWRRLLLVNLHFKVILVGAVWIFQGNFNLTVHDPIALRKNRLAMTIFVGVNDKEHIRMSRNAVGNAKLIIVCEQQRAVTSRLWVGW